MSKKEELTLTLKPSYDEEKTTQAAILLLKLNGGRMSYMKLIKLLYNADREALKRWSRPITFDDYYSLSYGQVVSNTMNLIRHNSTSNPQSFLQRHIQTIDMDAVLRSEPKNNLLSRAEIDLLCELDQRYKEWTQFDMADEHHIPEFFPEFVDPGESNIITEYVDLLEAIGMNEEGIADLISTLEESAILEKMA